MGIILLVFLTFLRITVTAGVVNSILLYSNILQTIKYSLLPSSVHNTLTVFLAWVNLDFGFQTVRVCVCVCVCVCSLLLDNPNFKDPYISLSTSG